MLYVLLWIIILIISVWLFYKASGSISLFKPNMISISFYYSFLVTCYIGSILIVLKIDNFYMMNKLPDDRYRIIGFIIMCCIMILFPLTMFIISKIVGFNSTQEFNDYFKKPINNLFDIKTEFRYIFFLMSFISVLAVLYTLLKTPTIPLIELLKGSSGEELARLRIDAGSNFSGNVLIKNIFAIALTPLLSLIAYIYSVKTNDQKWKIIFLCLFFSSIIINVYDLSKSPILFYLLMFFLARIYMGKTKLSWRNIAVFSIFSILILLIMYTVVFDVRDMGNFLSYSSGPIGRIILAQVSPLFLHLGYFGDVIPFLDGRSLPSMFLGLFDMEQVRSAKIVMEHSFPQNVENGTAGVLNTLYAGEAFANFGYLGIILGTVYIATFVQIIYIIFIRLPKNPIYLSLFIYFTINIPRALVGGFTDFLFNPLWVILVSLLVGILLFIRVRIDFTKYYRNLKEI